MTDARIAQAADVVGQTDGTGNAQIGPAALVVACTEVVFAALAKVSQAADIIAVETDSGLLTKISQALVNVAQSGSPNSATVSQVVLIIASSEPRRRIALYPFSIGNFPTQPMYRR